MKNNLPKVILINTIFLFLFVGSLFAQRQMENLNRGVVAINQGNSNVYINWRLFGTDPGGVSFNIYKSVAGGTEVKLNSSVITATTDFVDNSADLTKSNSYFVKAVINGVEQAASETYMLAANSSVKQYIPIPLASVSNGTYNVEHVYVGDVDGDGDYDYIVKRFLNSTNDRGIVLDCYLNTGTLKWRIYLGVNIETGNSSMTSPVLVYDFNGDGKAEVLLKTGEGTTFGNGTKIGDTNGDGITDYNTHVFTDLYQVTKDNCPEFLSLVNGSTGAEMARTNFIPRGAKSTWTSWWGDNYGHRMNFIESSVAYLDGVHPSVVFSRGPGEKMDVVAWDLSSGSFSKRWEWTSRGKSFSSGTTWVDFHQIKCVDVDGDGKDEISWGSGMLNDNSTIMYTTKLVHGDRFQIGDFNPNRAGLEVYAIQQNNPSLLGAALYDAKTGSILKEWYTSSLSDIGRGDVADVNSGTVGMELFSLASTSLVSCSGANVSSTRPYPDLSVWWDGDLGREFFVGIGSGGYSPAINKWNASSGVTDRIFSIYNDNGAYSVICPYAGRAPFIGDIMGDWREEIILESSDHSHLRIYTTVNPASNRIYTLMHNPAYRVDVTTKGYLCTKYPDFYLGWGMSTPPAPNITLVGNNVCVATTIVPYIQVNGGTWQNISSVTVNSGDIVAFGPQPASGGAWSWTGLGTSGTSRTQTISPTSSGTATATYTNACGATSTQTFTITINSTIIPVTGVTVSPATTNIMPGSTTTLLATVLPANATNKSVTWSTSNSAVATVSSTGIVTGVANGSAIITVRTVDQGKTATSAINVIVTEISVTGISVSPLIATINIGATTTLSAIISPSNASNKNVTWSSFDSKVAAVSSTGVVTGVSQGMVTITVTSQYSPGFYAVATITVNPSSTAPCANPVAITIPFSMNGIGEYCWSTSQAMATINSWNLDLLEVNGVDYTNTWSNSLPAAVGGAWYIHYKASVSWAHFEIPSLKNAEEELGESTSEPQMYPNPVTDILYLIGIKGVDKIQILDLKGKTLFESQNDFSEMSMDLSSYSKGIYIIKFTGKNINKCRFLSIN